jgi:hypothetical protein
MLMSGEFSGAVPSSVSLEKETNCGSDVAGALRTLMKSPVHQPYFHTQLIAVGDSTRLLAAINRHFPSVSRLRCWPLLRALNKLKYA